MDYYNETETDGVALKFKERTCVLGRNQNSFTTLHVPGLGNVMHSFSWSVYGYNLYEQGSIMQHTFITFVSHGSMKHRISLNKQYDASFSYRGVWSNIVEQCPRS